MSGWRFHPLRDAFDTGVLSAPMNGKPRAAVFLTLEQAKVLAERKAAR